MCARKAFKGVRFVEQGIERVTKHHARRFRLGIDGDQNARLVRLVRRHILEGRAIQQPKTKLTDVCHLAERAGVHRDEQLREAPRHTLHRRLNTLALAMPEDASPIRKRAQAHLVTTISEVRIRNRKSTMRAQLRRAVNALDTSRALHHRRMKFDTKCRMLRQSKTSGNPNKMP